MQIVNMTAHTLLFTNGMKLESSGDVRLSRSSNRTGEINGIPVFANEYGSATLPQKTFGVIYVVSKMVAEAYPKRDDLYIIANSKRDDKGRILALEGISRNPHSR